MDDAAPCGHQIARARMDRRIGAEAVAMVDRAFAEIGQSRQVDMRVRAHVHALPDVEMRGAELVDEDAGADHRPRLVRQGPPHLEGAAVVGRSEAHTTELQSLMRNSYA